VVSQNASALISHTRARESRRQEGADRKIPSLSVCNPGGRLAACHAEGPSSPGRVFDRAGIWRMERSDERHACKASRVAVGAAELRYNAVRRLSYGTHGACPSNQRAKRLRGGRQTGAADMSFASKESPCDVRPQQFQKAATFWAVALNKSAPSHPRKKKVPPSRARTEDGDHESFRRRPNS